MLPDLSTWQRSARETLAGLMTLFPSDRYQVTWWWHGDTLSARIRNRTTDHEHLAVWHRSVQPESVIASAAEWLHRGEPEEGIAPEEW